MTEAEFSTEISRIGDYDACEIEYSIVPERILCALVRHKMDKTIVIKYDVTIEQADELKSAWIGAAQQR